MTSQQFLLCDCSTVTSFKQWAQAISAFFLTAGWVQTSDTGQVNWSTISTVPGSGAYVYEVWKPGDALTVFYVKMEYGNNGGTNNPAIRISIATGTNGAGVVTGFIIGPTLVAPSTIGSASTTTQYECDFSGDPGRISAMMWRNAPGSTNGFFSIERSVNASGAWTGTYVTLWVCGNSGSGGTTGQQSLLFAVGPAPNFPIGAGSGGGWSLRGMSGGVFNNSIPLDTATPCIGYFDYPCTTVGTANGPDFVEAIPFSATLYGATRVYLPSKLNNYQYSFPRNNTVGNLCMRWD